MKRCVLLLFACALGVGVPSAFGASDTLTCGSVIVADTTLTEDLQDCATGLIVGADNVTIDLNGFAIRGLGADGGVGVEAIGRSGVTVKNGRITKFATGVSFFESAQSTISDIAARETRVGIQVDGSQGSGEQEANRIAHNTVKDSVVGIFTTGSLGVEIFANRVAGLSRFGRVLRQFQRRPDRGELCGAKCRRHQHALL